MKRLILALLLCFSSFSCVSFLEFLEKNPKIITETVYLGMTIAEVLIIEGEPQEIDSHDVFTTKTEKKIMRITTYKYKDKIITFENNKVVKIESI